MVTLCILLIYELTMHPFKALLNVIPSSCDEIIILVMGKTGVGKSTLINNLLDAQLAKVNEVTTGTYEVNTYKLNKYGYNFVIYDTPGLFDCDIDNDVIIKMIGEIKKINIVLLCHDLSQPRLCRDDLETFDIFKKSYGDNLLKYSILVFTKSNMVNDLNYKTKIIYDKIKLDIPFVNVHDNNSASLWKDQLWNMLITRTTNPDYMINANYLRITLGDPMKILIEKVKSIGLYPTNTNELIKKEIESRKSKNKRVVIAESLAGVSLSIVGTMMIIECMPIIVAATAASMIFPTLGFAQGIHFNKLNNIDCKEIELELMHKINEQHFDTYCYEDGKIAYEGYFLNNLPHGMGTAYTEEGKILWYGNFDEGVPDICKNIIL